LRAVASGLMMEKVRSIAMISSLRSVDGSCGLISVRPVHGKRCDEMRPVIGGVKLRRFHPDEPILKRLSRFHSAAKA